MTWREGLSGPKSGRTWALCGAVVQIGFAIALGLLRASNSSAGERRAEGILPTLALAAIFAVPGVLALAGVVIDRPILFVVGAAVNVPIAVISIAALPILVPAGLMLMGFAQATRLRPIPLLAALATLSCFIVLTGGALVILVSAKGTYSYTHAGGSEGGDYYLPRQAALALGMVVGGLALTTAIAARFTKRRAPSNL